MLRKKLGVFLLSIVILSSGCSIRNNANKNDLTFAIDQFSQAVSENRIEDVQVIIDRTFLDINQKDSSGRYPIELAVYFSNCEMVKTLLEAKAKPNVITSEGLSVYEVVMNDGTEYMKSIFKENHKEFQ